MGIFSGELSFGASDSPIVDSPYIQQFDVGVGNPPPIGNDFLLLDGSNLLLLEGGNFELLSRILTKFSLLSGDTFLLLDGTDFGLL